MQTLKLEGQRSTRKKRTVELGMDGIENHYRNSKPGNLLGNCWTSDHMICSPHPLATTDHMICSPYPLSTSRQWIMDPRPFLGANTEDRLINWLQTIPGFVASWSTTERPMKLPRLTSCTADVKTTCPCYCLCTEEPPN